MKPLVCLWYPLGSSDRAAMGRIMDARTQGWFRSAVSNLDGKREIVHGFYLVYETYAAADM